MQFHLNGFKLGNPEVSAPLEAYSPRLPSDALPEEVDVLIVGSGPAGLTLAAQLAAFPDIKTRIVEQKPERLRLGQADGVACRTMEMFEAFGFSERLLKEAYWVNETTFWKPDDQQRQNIARSGRIQDTEDGLSEFPHVILNQARVHDFYLDVMTNSPTRLEPDYSRRLLDLTIHHSASGESQLNREHASHMRPVTVRLQRTDPGHEGQVETVRARFVVGADGARSAVRHSLGKVLRGDSANQAWGVMDVLAITDFPDIRLKSTIHSATEGSVLIIPREGGYLVRLYIELAKLNENERVSSKNITSDDLIAAARRIMHPYQLDVKEVAWWSVYEIGRRLCDRFDDVSDSEIGVRNPSVFILGDACHTHSPKAGQGMNVSMQDAFNLGWKLASVVRGQSTPDILKTYSDERQSVAAELIDFDRKFATMFSAPPKDAANPDSGGVDPLEFQSYFVKQGRFTAGTETHYSASIISGGSKYQDLAKGFVIGRRFHSAPVIRLSDAKPVHLGHTVKADGRWRLFAFADAQGPTGASSKISALCDFLTEPAHSPVRKYTRQCSDVDSVIDVRAIFQQNYRQLDIGNMPALLLPQKGRYELRDYEKVFCAIAKGAENIFDARGINRNEGCIVVVRPDQHVAHVLPLDAFEELNSFFDRFMVVLENRKQQ